ncbi:helix-turn-helix domain-containing protein [Desulfobulbus alkaliphilus]|uniref:helix-turn-helix domain-containing protein n=1 Tax=Desulfobulbus alkaliphilus TaxID=869814 RepID=UPI0019653158|nr:helix-turn-helix domain-containing protein [Desulfobulbus alkaliphilus]MBM9537212.1 helix-turn-helix domain-containing protein [Desulfobulbus alkaliphilus]
MVRPISEPQPIHHLLRSLRENKGLTLEEVSRSTRISLSNLRAIESLQYEKLPADPFTKGMLILYGTFLDLDGREIASRFFWERDGGKAATPSPKKYLARRSLSPKDLAEPAHFSSATIAGILMTLITVSLTGFCLYTSWNPFIFLTKGIKNSPAATISPFHPADPSSGTIPGQVDSAEISVLSDGEMSVALNISDAKTIRPKKTGQLNPLIFSRLNQFVPTFDPSSTVLLSHTPPANSEDQSLRGQTLFHFTP